MLHFFLFVTFLLPFAWAEQIVIVSFGSNKKLSVYSISAKNGALHLRSNFPLESGAGPMCVNRAGTRLYVSMKETGKLAALQIGDDASLTLLGETHIGADVSFLTLHPEEKSLLTSYYKVGKVAVHSIFGSTKKTVTAMAAMNKVGPLQAIDSTPKLEPFVLSKRSTLRLPLATRESAAPRTSKSIPPGSSSILQTVATM
ncbi:MAG: hypothetical protein ACJAVK_000002 [Akkermansiaceae bacterium]|jgi:hypothetical protein